MSLASLTQCLYVAPLSHAGTAVLPRPGVSGVLLLYSSSVSGVGTTCAHCIHYWSVRMLLCKYLNRHAKSYLARVRSPVRSTPCLVLSFERVIDSSLDVVHTAHGLSSALQEHDVCSWPVLLKPEAALKLPYSYSSLYHLVLLLVKP